MFAFLRDWCNSTWIIGRGNERNHVRLYPNPGFLFTIFGKKIKYSKFYGWSVK